jgi:hypothetical protein
LTPSLPFAASACRLRAKGIQPGACPSHFIERTAEDPVNRINELLLRNIVSLLQQGSGLCPTSTQAQGLDKPSKPASLV